MANNRISIAADPYTSSDSVTTSTVGAKKCLDVNIPFYYDITDTVSTDDKGMIILGNDGTNYKNIKTDSNGNLQVDILTMPQIEAVIDTITSITNSVKINDGGGSITVDGTVAVTNSDITTIAGAIDGNEVQVDVVTMPTTTVEATNLDIRDLTSISDSIAAVQSGTWNIGTLTTLTNPVGIKNAAGDSITGIAGTYDTLDVSITDGTNRVDIIDSGTYAGIGAYILDGSGDPVTTFGAGTQYTEGDTDATITGTALMWEDGSDTLVVASAAKPLPIEVTDASIAVTGTFWQATQPVSIAGTVTVDLGANNDVTLSTLPDTAATDLALQTADLDTIAGDTTSIDGKITVCDTGAIAGTVTANLSATDNAVLDDIAADTESIKGYTDGIETLLGTIDTDTGNIATSLGNMDNAVDGNYLNVNMNIAGTDVAANAGVLTAQTLRVTIATDDEVNNSNAAIQTATELIDDSVYVDDADWTADTSKHILAGAVTQATTTINTDGDTTPLVTNTFRELRTAYKESDLATIGTTHVKKYYTNAGAVTDGIVWSPAAGKRWYITDIIINVSAASTVTLEDDLAGGDSPVWKAELAANGGMVCNFQTPLYSGEDAADLILTSSAGNIYCTVCGYEI